MGAPKSQFLERVLEKLKRKAISGPGTLLHKGSQEIMENKESLAWQNSMMTLDRELF